MGQRNGDSIMIEFLKMGGYAEYVWSSYAIVAIVMFLNVYTAWKRYKKVKKRLIRLHSEDNEK
jgi:heme exporter protein CcmD